MTKTEGVSDRSAAFTEAVELIRKLRGPGGCAWDREQTFDSLKPHTLEETYEVFDAIERRAWANLKDELGDLLLQVLLYSQIAEEAGLFAIEDVVKNLNAKLIRRHPHVFGTAVAKTADDVKRNWELIKQAERSAAAGGATPAASQFLDTVPRHVPAMTEAMRLGKRAGEVGFDWPKTDDLFDKLAEESQELKSELSQTVPSIQAQSDELGDLLFTAVNLARHLKLEPEFALRAANAKFRSRFNLMEAAAGGHEELNGTNFEELNRLWQAAKVQAAKVQDASPAVLLEEDSPVED